MLSKAATDSFKVSKANGNGAATFAGLVAKYDFANATSFTHLAVGESVDVTHSRAPSSP